MGDMPLVRASPFSWYWRRAYYRHMSHLIAKGDALVVEHLTLIRKRDVSPFILPRPAWYRCLVPPCLLKLMLLSF
jgi:hypothetical protein